jgi:hypothetical protein
MRMTLKALGIAAVTILLAGAPAAAEPNPGQSNGPIAFPGFKFGPVLVQGSGTQDVDQAGKIVEASGTGTVTNFPYLGDSTYTYDVVLPPPELCPTCLLLGSFTVTSPQGSVKFPFIGCSLTLHGGECRLNPQLLGSLGPPEGTGAAAGVEGFATAHLKWIPIRGGHIEGGFIVPALTKTTEAR